MDMLKLLLAVFTAVPALTHAAEEISAGFPGQGQVKKQAVLDGLSTILSVGAALGVQVNTTQVLTAAGNAIDAYVAVANTVGLFQHGGAPGHG